jgi:hypothetical protein
MKAKPRDPWHERMIASVTEILRAGDSSKFEYEAACRYGIRSHLCLKGALWDEADQRAASIVTAALDQIKAVRPTFWEGQSDYADTDTSAGFCARGSCGRPIPVDLESSNGTPIKYCSKICKNRAHADRARIHGNKSSLAEYLAVCAAQSERTLHDRARDCPECGKHFLTRDPSRKYCSRRCWREATAATQSPCARCGAMFTPKNSGDGKITKFCSKECSGAARIKDRVERQCPTCLSIFRPAFPSKRTRFCSLSCAAKYGQMAKRQARAKAA